jgi:hypothetical protein
MIMDNSKIPTALDVLNALLLVTETNLEQAKKDFVDARNVWLVHKENSGNMVTFNFYLRDVLDDLTRMAVLGERAAMLTYFIKILNESKEMCQ